MKIRIVTDSTADLPLQLASDLGIVVVPAYVHFGDNIYRVRVDITEEAFYQRLEHDPVHPHTEPPTPQDFAAVYRRLCDEADGVISIHISSRLSATCNAAARGRDLLGKEAPIQVVDSKLVTVGLGLLAIAAAGDAGHSDSLAQAADQVRRTILHIRVLGLFDTLKYLERGGRIDKVKAVLGSALKVKPLLTMRDGELESAGQVRTRADGIDRLLRFISSTPNIQDLAVVHSTTPEEAQRLVGLMSQVFCGERIRLARLGSALGVHGGPGILFVGIRVSDVAG